VYGIKTIGENFMKKILITAAALLVLGSVWYLVNASKARKNGQYSSAEAVMTDLSEYVEITGYVAPLNRVEVLPASGGRIEKILVEEGDKIKSGQLMALMSSTDRVAILDAARAMGDEQYKYWQDAYKPIKVVSPLDGTIILKNIVEGQTVGASTVLFAVSDKLILEATVDESDIGKVKTGQAAFITLDAYPDKPVSGKVFQILDEGTTSNNVITYKVKIRPDTVPAFFKSQMTANIKLRISAGRKVLLVPAAAVVIGPSGSTAVMTSIAGPKPVYKDVVTGANEGRNVEIVSGLEDGDAVYYSEKTYVPQKEDASSSNPLIPKMNRRRTSAPGSGARSGAAAPPPGN